MQRSIEHLERHTFDLVVIGGGIHGAWAAAEAALRGLRVALLERGDFGGATSGNSQKIVHGGLRYLQHGDLRRVRESIRERSILMRLAPTLVRPLPVLVPLGGGLRRGRLAMQAAMLIAEAMAWGPDRDLPAGQRLPRGRIVNAKVWRAAGGPIDGVRAAALFHDAQLVSPERLLMAVLHTAARAGASLANHARVEEVVASGGRVRGVRAVDGVTGRVFEVAADAVLNCAGPWVSELAGVAEPQRLLKAVALVARGGGDGPALALPSAAGRHLFITPWRGVSIIGTFYTEHDGPPSRPRVLPEELDGYLEEVRRAGWAIEHGDVLHVCAGLLPAQGAGPPEQSLSRRARLVEHGARGGPRGLVSVVGVKLTTARAVAERAVDRVVRWLGRGEAGRRTHRTALDGGAFAGRAPLATAPGADQSIPDRLAALYGRRAARIMALARDDRDLAEPVGAGLPVPGAEVVHAVREEMAQHLADVVFRRTDVGAWGYPGRACLERCAALMGRELGWDRARAAGEVEAVRRLYEAWGATALEHDTPVAPAPVAAASLQG